MTKTYIIAEAGVNHNGDEKLAFKLIEEAKKAGADAIKFQLFETDALVTPLAQKASYQLDANNDSQHQYQMLKELELSQDSMLRLHQYAQELAIDFMLTPFDLNSLNFIIQILKLPIIKLGSGDITNGPLLLTASRSNAHLILSTGMCALGDIEKALQVITFGMTNEGYPTQNDLNKINIQVRNVLAKRVSILHCVSQYPAPLFDLNLRSLDTLKAAFGLNVGFSDHSLGINASLAAVARGAEIIEKHFTLDKTLKGPDHQASLDIPELQQLVKGIREIEVALGEPIKAIAPCEKENVSIVRRSIVASQAIRKGEVLEFDNLGIKRPAGGISPMHYWDLIGKIATRDYDENELIYELH